MRRRAAIAAAGVIAFAAAGSAAAQGGGHGERFATTCAPCHGAQGVSTMEGTPSLAGQPSFYAITQLFLFRDGRRDNALMTAVAKGMSDGDLRGFSDAIAALPAPPAPPVATDAARAARGAEVAGRLRCAGCHGAAFDGGRQVPRIGGQREDYLLAALQGFRSARRIGYTPAMTEALAGTTPDELQDLAYFLAHAPPPR